MSKTHYSAAELAALKLPGLPGTEQNVRAMAEREGWNYTEVAARGRTGKRKEFAVSALPAAARSAVDKQFGRQLSFYGESAEITLSLTVSLEQAGKILRMLRKAKRG